ncbi:MAG: zinc ribbon domain-containing protein [Candidatus Thorarchaeota archaeon]|jgi:hypothetical protein
MKVRGGHLKKNIEIEAGDYNFVEIPVREGTRIEVSAAEVDGDTFSVCILDSSDVKRAPLIGTVMDYDDSKPLWHKDKVKKVNKEYIADRRDTLFVFFDNHHAKSKYKSIDIDVRVDHPPLMVGDAPLRESFEVDAKFVETIEVEPNAGDTIRVFGRVTKGNDITVHVLAQIYDTPDTIHTDKAYFTKEKVEEIDIEYHVTKREPLLIVFDNGYSMRTTKTVDVSVQVIKGEESKTAGIEKCPFCQAKLDGPTAFCPHCGGKL